MTQISIKHEDIQGAIELARELFEGKNALDAHWQGDELGMDRPGYSLQENEAISVITEQAHKMDMDVYQDIYGNIFMIRPGADRHKGVMMMGSHLDAVPKGGRYDGAAGVVAGLAVAKTLHDNQITTPQDFVVSIWRNEESPWFGKYALGSHMATAQVGAEILDEDRGDSNQEELKRSSERIGRYVQEAGYNAEYIFNVFKEHNIELPKILATAMGKANQGDYDLPSLNLAHYMDKAGLDVEAARKVLAEGKVTLPNEQIAGFYEVHIEQGEELKNAGKSLGFVTMIRGNLRYKDGFNFIGEAGHTGAVPQEERRDANSAASHFVTYYEEALKKGMPEGDYVSSTPRFKEGPDAANTTIPALTTVFPEVRSTSVGQLYAARDIIEAKAKKAAKDRRCEVSFDQGVISKPCNTDLGLRRQLVSIADEIGIPAKEMPSGAGHDSTVIGNAGVRVSLTFLRHNGLSHRPDEYMTVEKGQDPFELTGDFASAVLVHAKAAMMEIDEKDAPERRSTFAEALEERGAKLIPFA